MCQSEMGGSWECGVSSQDYQLVLHSLHALRKRSVDWLTFNYFGK